MDWDKIRGEFRLDPLWAHFTHFFLASPPARVREAATRWREQIEADPYVLASMLFGADFGAGVPVERQGNDGNARDSAGNPFYEVKRALAEYVGGAAHEIALMPSTTAGLALVYHGLSIRPDQEMVSTVDGHYAQHEAMRRAAEKRGASVRLVALYEEPSEIDSDRVAARLRAEIRPTTRAVGVTWVSSCTGVKLPLSVLAEVVDEANRGRAEQDRCLLIVDGVHGLGVEDIRPAQCGIDFFAAGAHKWLLGPAGTGLLWGRTDAWPHVSPTIPSFEVGAALRNAWLNGQPLPATEASFVSPGGFAAYENVLALFDVMAFHREIGQWNVAERISQLNSRVRAALSEHPRIHLYTPVREAYAGPIVCFALDRWSPDEAVALLAERKIRVAGSPYRLPCVRLSAGLPNSEDDVDILIDELWRIA